LSGKEPPARKGKDKVALLNLDSEETGPASTTNSSVVIDSQGLDETPLYKKLVKKLTSCADCPHERNSYCLKTADNAHVRFTAQQVKAWAKAWVILNFQVLFQIF
jgi:hypothetical protein